MAVNRFTSAPAPMQHTGKFFQLPVEQLSQALLKQDEEYKKLQDGFDTYIGELNQQEYLPKDEAIIAEKNKALMEEEQRLRERVGGDILNPLYIDGLRKTLGKVALDPFRKNAKFNTKMYWDVYQPTALAHVTKTGQPLQDWQYATQAFFNKYEGVDKSGVAPFSTPQPLMD